MNNGTRRARALARYPREVFDVAHAAAAGLSVFSLLRMGGAGREGARKTLENNNNNNNNKCGYVNGYV